MRRQKQSGERAEKYTVTIPTVQALTPRRVAHADTTATESREKINEKRTIPMTMNMNMNMSRDLTGGQNQSRFYPSPAMLAPVMLALDLEDLTRLRIGLLEAGPFGVQVRFSVAPEGAKKPDLVGTYKVCVKEGNYRDFSFPNDSHPGLGATRMAEFKGEAEVTVDPADPTHWTITYPVEEKRRAIPRHTGKRKRAPAKPKDPIKEISDAVNHPSPAVEEGVRVTAEAAGYVEELVFTRADWHRIVAEHYSR